MSDSFHDLMERLRLGEDQAAREVFGRFTGRLAGLARRHLSDRLAMKVDPEDVVQSAYKSFFVRQREGGWEVFSWDGLWGILTTIVVRKCANRAVHFGADKRDISRELGNAKGDLPGPDETLVDREPLPEEAVCLTEVVQALFESLEDEDERSILELSLQGHTATEISHQIGRAERSVRRLRERIRKKLERMRDDI